MINFKKFLEALGLVIGLFSFGIVLALLLHLLIMFASAEILFLLLFVSAVTAVYVTIKDE